MIPTYALGAACAVIGVVMLVLIGRTLVACRVENMRADANARARPITQPRWRRLNIVDRCDGSTTCPAPGQAHEAWCLSRRP